MKNLLIIHPDLVGGGAEKVLVNILDNIDYNKYKVTLLLIYKRGIYLSDINKNVKVKYLYEYDKFRNKLIQGLYARIISLFYDKYPNILLKYMVGYNFDTEIAFLEGEATKLISKRNNKNAIKVSWIHCDLGEYQKYVIDINKKYYEKIDRVICVSNECKKSFDSIYPMYKEKSSVIYNLINIDTIRKLSQENIEYKFNKPTIVAVGRLVKTKRFDILIKAHKILIEKGINNNIVIVGEGDERLNLEKLIKSLGVDKTVKLIGFTKNPYPYIKNATIFAITSEYEGFSLVGAEAILLGKPIISTKCAGLIELLNDGEYGELIDINDHNMLNEVIEKLLLDNNLIKYYRDMSLKRSPIFNPENILNKIYDILE